jgi:catechol 2,3-dioxygenase-like lactoylglutathione lyase family enzyme
MKRTLGIGLCVASIAVATALPAPTSGSTSGEAASPTLGSPGFHHLHLNAVDPEAEIAFYTRYFESAASGEMLGFPAIRTGHVWVLFTKVSAAPKDQPQSAYWHFGWHVPDTPGYWRRYQAIGAPLVPMYTDEGATVTFSNEWWPGLLMKKDIPAAAARGTKAQKGGFGYLRGPSGERVEFQGDEPAERFNHVHMFQEDVFCAELWYQKHLNAALSKTFRRQRDRVVEESNCRVPPGEPTWLSLVPEGTVRQPPAGVAFDDVEMNWYPRQGEKPLASSKGQVIDHVGLSVHNLAAWHEKLRHEDVTILERPHAVGHTRAFVIEGPSRERIELVEVN